MTDMATTSEMATTNRPELEESGQTSPVTSQPTSTDTHPLITEQQVLFSTASAVALPPAKTRRLSGAIHAVSAALRAMFAASEKPPARKHYPKRHVWLDNALMAREMDRL
ncbi:MAG TPA: hypothetical protein VH185_00280 [Mycobacterium sp.]|jgi:hypothetical protein|nr:hypothetical protein [Mycobacterium sp.]